MVGNAASAESVATRRTYILQNRVTRMKITKVRIRQSWENKSTRVVVIKWEYHWGSKSWPGLLVIGSLLVIISILTDNMLLSGGLGIFGAALLWGVHELFRQRKRVERGWFPRNPKGKR